MVRTQINDLSTKPSDKDIRTREGGGRRKVFNGSNAGTSTLFFRLNHVHMQVQNQVKMSNTFLQATRVLITTIPIG